ncbi:hypothetical protein MP228_011986 [Amoeboaphelidium protococcarum]|nr:hypothetical protein MP228_011986 [Amoeboaphelidium protococcarum]
MVTQQSILHDDQVKNLLAGALSGCITAIVTCPLDVLKTRLQNQGALRDTQYSGIIPSLRLIWREEGVRGLYRGLSPTILGYLPTWTVYFWSYDRYKLYIAKYLQASAQDSRVHILGAILAGTTSNIVTNPLWLVKTRMMTFHQYKQLNGDSQYYRNTFDAFRQIYVTDGLLGFYRGLVPSLFGVAHVAVQFPLYERLKADKFADRLMYSDRVVSSMGDPSQVQIFFSSTISKAIASMTTYPHEVLRTRLQSSNQNCQHRRRVWVLSRNGHQFSADCTCQCCHSIDL